MRALLAAAALVALAGPAAAQDRQPPYWASIAAGEAMMRTGPDRGYPAIWAYRRRDLPIRVLRIQGAWRQVREQDGSTGWMLATLLAARRTAIVTGATRTIREDPSPGGRALWQAEPGVVGRLSHCADGWCRIQIGEKTGYIAQTDIWGTDPGETIK